MAYFTLANRNSALLKLTFLLLGMLLAGPLPALSQGRATVSGTVTGASGAAVEFATVTLHRAADSTVVKTEFSDAQGHFLVEATSGAQYRVSAVQVGFGRTWSAPFTLPVAGLVVPVLALPASAATALKEVTVTARKPLFEHEAGRTVVNVADSPLAAGATALDVLARSPGVTVDGGDNLALRGRQGLLVVLDGKRVPLTGAELAVLLRALPAEQLQSLELLTTPPAKYDAQGGAGVIVINLKKDQRQGTNGSFNAGYGRGEYGKFTGGIALNYRHKKVSLSGSYGYVDRRGFLRIGFTRQYAADAGLPSTRSQQNLAQTNRLQSHSGKVGLDFAISKRTLLGAAATVLASQSDNLTATHSVFYGDLPGSEQRFTATAGQDTYRPSGTLNFNLRHAFADSVGARSLSFDADFGRYRSTRLLDLNTEYEQPALSPVRLTGDQRSSLVIQSLKVDYSQPLPHRTRLDAGSKATQVSSDNDVVFVNAADGQSAVDPTKSTRFRYDENVNAAYVALARTLARTTLQAGLRAEQTNTLGQQSVDDSRFERHYFQLFPNASVQRTINEHHSLALSVNRRIDRPSYGQVNPIRTYLDVTAYRSGNPALRPQTSYNVEISHTYRQRFTTGLTYSRIDLPIVNVIQPAPDGNRIIVNRDVNLTTENYYALTFTAPFEPAKWWSVYANGVFYYARFRGALAGTLLDHEQPACILTLNNSLSLPGGGWSAELNGTYQSPEIFGFEVARPRGQVSAGVQKNLWSKQGTLRLNVADIFYTAPVGSTSNYVNFSESFRSAQDTRVATLAFTYRFGNSKVGAARKRAVGAEEELRRATGQ